MLYEYRKSKYDNYFKNRKNNNKFENNRTKL